MATTDYPSPDEVEITAINAGVCVIVRDPEGRVLMHRRSDNGLWGLPGGAIEPGESVTAAAEREALEETGLRVRVERLFGVYSDPRAGMVVRYPDGNVRHYVVVVVVARPTGGPEQAPDDETTELGWFDPGHLPEDIVPAHRARLGDLTAGRMGVLG